MQITAFSGWGCTGRIALGIHKSLEQSGNQSVIAWGRENTAPENVPTIKIGNKLDQQLHGLYTRLTDKCGFASIKTTEHFIKEIDTYNPDLIQIHILHGYYVNLEILFNYIKRKNIPVVWTFHDCWAFTGHCPYFDLVGCEKWIDGCHSCEQKSHHPTSWLLDNSVWNWKKKKELFTKINNMTIVAPSKWMAGLVKKSFLKDCRIEIINNGINLRDFKPTPSNILERIGCKDKKVVLGVSSTWVKSKGIDDFIQLSKILPDDYRIVLVGLTAEQKKNLPIEIVGIERTDSVKELAELYTAASVFVNPTYEDNYPTTNLEAISCGTPVITYRTGGSIEAVEQSGFGKIVNQRDIEGIRDAILESDSMSMPDYSALKLDQNELFMDYVQLYEDILRKG